MTDVAVTVINQTTRVVTTDDSPPVTVAVTDETVAAVTTETVVHVSAPDPVIRVATVAEQGPPGADGSGVPYVHNQTVPAATWTVTHTLGHVAASVTVWDSTGAEVEGDVINNTTDTVTLSFSGAFAGVARIL
jgi:hypothetical protein